MVVHPICKISLANLHSEIKACLLPSPEGNSKGSRTKTHTHTHTHTRDATLPSRYYKDSKQILNIRRNLTTKSSCYRLSYL